MSDQHRIPIPSSMDAAAFFALQAAENDDDKAADEDVHHVITTAAVLTIGAEVAHLLRNERRKPS